MSDQEQDKPQPAGPEPTASPAAGDAYEVVEAYGQARAAEPGRRGLLGEWMDRHPQFREELAAASWLEWREGPDWRTASEPDDEAEDLEIAALGRRLLAERFAESAPAPAPLASLVEEAKQRGLSQKAFAQALGTDVPLLARLEQRLIRGATIPRLLVERLSQTLDRSHADVAAYLRAEPRLAYGAHYRARRAPQAGGQDDFARALSTSPPELRAFWQEQTARGGVLGEDKTDEAQ